MSAPQKKVTTARKLIKKAKDLIIPEEALKAACLRSIKKAGRVKD